MNTRIFIIAFLIIVAGFAACKHEVPIGTVVVPGGNTGGGGTGGGGGGTGGGGTGSTLVCFQSDILPIFQTNCAKSSCHDAASHQKDYVLDNYNNIVKKGIRPGDASESKIYRVLFETGNDKMPRPPNPDLTPAQKALIGRWINEGAQNTTNCNNSSSGCDTTKFKYSADIQPILAANCTGCHNATTFAAGLNFTQYDVVKQTAINGRLVGTITHTPGYSPMPRNAAKLSDCKITQIKKWIAAGALNN
ncbi:MAG: hypothetical protein ABIO05_08940 [Ferruginibacter sp.]